MKNGIIEVVKYENELFFKSDGILLDLLDAADFYNADLSVKRSGKDFDTGYVYEMGTHAPVPVFSRFNNLEKFKSSHYPNICQLVPEYFEEGDQIHFALKPNFDWEVDYRKRYAGTVIHDKFKERYDLMFEFVNDEKFEEEHQRIAEEVEKEIEAFVFPENPILRRKIV